MTNDTINDNVTIAGGGRTMLAWQYRVIRQLEQGANLKPKDFVKGVMTIALKTE